MTRSFGISGPFIFVVIRTADPSFKTFITPALSHFATNPQDDNPQQKKTLFLFRLKMSFG